jgi:hypothetical protein
LRHHHSGFGLKLVSTFGSRSRVQLTSVVTFADKREWSDADDAWKRNVQ